MSLSKLSVGAFIFSRCVYSSVMSRILCILGQGVYVSHLHIHVLISRLTTKLRKQVDSRVGYPCELFSVPESRSFCPSCLSDNCSFVFPKIKNNHLNQAIHEEREAIIELRVQLRLLQLQRAKPEPQGQDDDEPERRGGAAQPPRDSALETKAAKEPPKAGKEQAKPSPSRDRKETPI